MTVGGMTVADLTRSAEWAALKRHRQSLAKTRIADLFRDDPQRFQHFSLQLDEFAFDYSKNLATAETMRLLRDLARRDRRAHRDGDQYRHRRLRPRARHGGAGAAAVLPS